MRRLGWLGACVAAWAGFCGAVAMAQTAATLVEVPVPLLGPKMGTAVRTGDAVTGQDPAGADTANAAALKEDGLQRFSKATYGRTAVEALQFNDASGARAAFSMYLKAGTHFGLKPDEIGAQDTAMVDGRSLVLAQTVVLIGEKGADGATLANIAGALPKIGGPRSQAPLLPTFFPSKGKIDHSLRYSLGPAGYQANGGTLPADQLGWEKSGEAASAEYADRRGRETLTLLLYPTPQIAGEHLRSLEKMVGAAAKIRREGELVAVAQGTFSSDDAQNMIENIHLRSEVSFDKPMPLQFPTEIRKTYSLLKSIVIFSAIGSLAAILLGVFLGFGRAGIRKLRGKEASSDIEFLSLHLDPQTERVKFDAPPS